MRASGGRRPLFRGAAGATLLCVIGLASIGCCWDLVTVASAMNDGAGGDGLGMFFPVIGALLLAPLQLLAVIALASALVWRLDVRTQDDETRARHARNGLAVSVLAGAALGVPALVMGVVTALEAALPYSDAVHELLFTIAEPGTLLWAPLWTLGMLLTGLALGRYERAWPVLLSPLYPIAGALYMFS